MFFDSKTTIITKVIIMHSKTKTFFTIIYSFSNQIMTTIVYLIFKQLGIVQWLLLHGSWKKQLYPT